MLGGLMPISPGDQVEKKTSRFARGGFFYEDDQ